MSFVDTHCHIHEADYTLDRTEAYERALAADVKHMICVGTDERSSEQAVEFAAIRPAAWASIGLHPHDAKNGTAAMNALQHLVVQPRVVAVGECGLDYFYNHSPKQEQTNMLRAQIELALQHDKPVIFHVRDAFDDFWPIFDEYSGIRGVLHSFTDTRDNLNKAIDKGLYIGVNGISTFTRADEQIDMYKSVPLQNILLETDAPYLTPVPMRGSINEPAYVTFVARHLAALHAISLKELAGVTTSNATNLFLL